MVEEEKKEEEKHPIRHRKNSVIKITEFETYALFLSMPRDERQKTFGYYTDQDFALGNKVHPDTLSVWKQDPKLWQTRDKYMIRLKQYTADVLGGLRKTAAEKGSAAEAKLWMQIIEKFIEKGEQRFDIPALEKLDEKINRILDK